MIRNVINSTITAGQHRAALDGIYDDEDSFWNALVMESK